MTKTEIAGEPSRDWIAEDHLRLTQACDRVFGIGLTCVWLVAAWLAFQGRVGILTPLLLLACIVENVILSKIAQRSRRPLRVEAMRSGVNVFLTAYIYVVADGALGHFWVPAVVTILGAAMLWSTATRRAPAGFAATLATAGALLIAHALASPDQGWDTVLKDVVGLVMVGFVVSLASAVRGETLNLALLGRREAEDSKRELALSLARLTETQQQLMDASRRAGMADVATTVLHNVGNVLNSVNVSASIVGGIVRGSKAGGIGKVAELLRQHEDALGSFLVEDPRGQKIPQYLSALAEAIEAERAQTTSELDSLTRNIDHIKAIVTLQQSHTKTGGVIERVCLSGLLEDALKFNFASYERHGVDVARDFCELADVEVDRHKLFQIVMNLLSNARHAVEQGEGPLKQISLRTRLVADDTIAVQVRDNGCGIPAENLDKIFQHGFTTKPDGHGFGLHSAACAATELGGSLSVQSEGSGKGAAFTLLVPVRVSRDQALEAAA